MNIKTVDSKVTAGEFAVWLNEFIQTMKGYGKGYVPCRDCVGCCTSSKFVLVRPSDKETIKKIPKEILFQAPGLPKGHYLMGYDEKGHCPMFKSDQCSIYEFCPETCKQYDCRVMAASGITIKDESADITNKIRSWEFDYSSDESQKLSNAVKLAGIFLSEYRDDFPEDFVPLLDSQLSVLAIRVHSEFIEQTDESVRENPKSLVDILVSKYSRGAIR